MLELLFICQTVFMVGAVIWIGGRTRPAKVPAPAIEPVATPGHTLTKTWMEAYPDDKAYAGWRWKCSCGVRGAATNCSKSSLGSETNAIARFKEHAQGYREVNFDAQKTEYAKLEAEYKEYRGKCYCKDSNDDLILLNHRHLDK